MMSELRISKSPKSVVLLFLIVIGSGALSASEKTGVLNVYNWADYIGETTLADFEKEYGVKINYDVYDSTEIVDAKLMAGNTGYDVIVHAASNAARLIPHGMYLALDKSKLPNWKNLDPVLLANVEQYDPGNNYGVPYMWGTTGFSYNRGMLLERMKDPPLNSASLIFDPAIVSRFADCGVTLLDSPGEVISMAMIYLGHDSNSVEPAHLKQVEELLRSIRPYIKYFNSTKMLMDLPSKEVCIAMSWSGDYSVASSRARAAGIEIDLGYNIPIEGSLIWFDVAYIPSDAPNLENAYLFLDYIMRPEVIADISNFTGYANANLYATELVSPEITSDPGIYPDEVVLNRLSSARVLAPKIERRRSRVWTRVKSGL
jgi:putrescine transport system substrate-binding protein